MRDYYLAIDIGASSGRHMLGFIEDGRIYLEEIYRFENGMTTKNDHLIWDVERLFSEIKEGLKEAKRRGCEPKYMSIDTWAVDYVLLDSNDEIVGSTYGYRDHRTDDIPDKVYEKISKRKLYEKTGIQKQNFNTIYQLYALKLQEPEVLEKAKTMLMLPDYFIYRLTGVKKQEYTNASSTGLLNASSCSWDDEIIEALGLPGDIFLPVEMPGAKAGKFTDEIKSEIGYDCMAVLCASHDTGSAIMALPTTEENTLYISSGTWSLMGVENKEPITTEEAERYQLTNEGGYDRRYRFLKNIMGLWMIQSVRHEMDDKYSFAELCSMAEEEKDFPSRVDVNDNRFLSPENMTAEIQRALSESGQKLPENTGQLATVIYQSLAESYAATKKEIESVTGITYDAVYIVGGGSKADYLNKLTAEKCGCKVFAGPGEGTAIGNLMAQMIRTGDFGGLKAARECVKKSFEIKEY
ncbi:MAG: rhamnulokinase [Lachnospiraceae bacterium]|nr:rhamnulokinase [Lachnospiraceae bacterium]